MCISFFHYKDINKKQNFNTFVLKICFFILILYVIR